MLNGFMRLLKRIRGATLVPTPVIPDAGSTKTTDPWSRSKVGPVVKVWVTVPTIVFPAVSLTPVIVSV